MSCFEKRVVGDKEKLEIDRMLLFAERGLKMLHDY